MFGTKSTTPAPSFGFGAGATTANKGFSFAQPATGGSIGFGTSQPSTSGIGFGTAQPASSGLGFGATQSTSTGLGFGATQPTSTGLGFGATQPTSTGLGFGATQPTSTGLAFGAAQPTSTGLGFGAAQPTSTGLGFGLAQQNTGPLSFSSTPSSGGLFGPKPAASTGFNLSGGGLFNPPKTSAPTFGGFGTNTSGTTFKPFGTTTTQQPFQPTGGLFGQTPQHQQNVDPSVALYLAVCAPTYFNDERDEVLKKWNQVQAVWGAGKGYYAQNMAPIDFQPDNPFCRFKAVGYIKLPSYTPEDGFVEITLGAKEADVKSHQQQIVDSLLKLFEGCQVCVDYVQPLGETKTRMCIYVQQRNPNGETKKAQAWMVYSHLTSQNQNVKQTLNNLSVESVTPLVSLTESQLKEYLDNPPQGIDPMIWEQGKRANPDPKIYLPVPMVGFQQLKTRFKAQEEESRLLQGQLDGVADEITQLEGKQSKLVADLQECKRKQLLISHRVLKLVVKQEVNRKRGVPIEQAEEHLRMFLESVNSQLASPTQYMGRLNELLSQISVQPGSGGIANRISEQRYALDAETESDLHKFLSWEQDAIKEIVSIVKKDIDVASSILGEKST